MSVYDPIEALYLSQYGNWYPKLRKYAPKSTIINLDELQPEFLEWFEEDGVILSEANDLREPGTKTRRDVNQEAGEVLSDDDSDDSDTNKEPQFTELNAKIYDIIDKYGPVFPKLNWSAPLDAAWILPGNMIRCQSPNDIYLLLKSSDFAVKDIEQVKELQKECEIRGWEKPHVQLVLKKWFEMPRSHEFRVFVRNGRMIAISQRDITFYEHLQDRSTQERIQDQIYTMFDLVKAAVPLPDMAIDIYLTRNLDNGFVIDINPYLPRTDTFLWTFEELEECANTMLGASHKAPLRVITSSAQASQSQPTYSFNMYR
ncbi:hypothetical protein MYAM1_000294 [Malassezia yamatoensis]|uniref:Cell division cycle protein 123 n=1 Tax=Malassezia yamatoensis TaxID=253288 RepID=A0AAJ5YNJ0_9BASI|nr:hypothetical protein MYAM1_000294 [Malassezia yamatoensis]